MFYKVFYYLLAFSILRPDNCVREKLVQSGLLRYSDTKGDFFEN